MSQPVKLSDVLVLDARVTAKIVDRSIAGQIEYWANLGRAIEPLLQGTHALALCKKAAARPLSECLEMADSNEGRRRLNKYLNTIPYPHYAPAPNKPGLLIRTDKSGKRTVGRFVNREFQSATKKA